MMEAVYLFGGTWLKMFLFSVALNFGMKKYCEWDLARWTKHLNSEDHSDD